MILPGIYAIFSAASVGFLVGPNCLAGLIGGAIASGMILATMMANSGGAWDNAKKYIEIEGAYGGKGTAMHQACVVGDTVGDPFKDTCGPSLNILIKLMSIVALTVAPSMRGFGDFETTVWGLIPLSVMIVATILVWMFFWRSGKEADTNVRIEQLQGFKGRLDAKQNIECISFEINSLFPLFSFNRTLGI